MSSIAPLEATVPGDLRDRLLLSLRDGAWHSLDRARLWLAPLLPDAEAVRRYRKLMRKRMDREGY